jgi:Bacterial protein of unknown function (DUF945)
MKKILGTLLGLALVYVGICFSLGFVAESSIKEQLEHHNNHSGQLNGVRFQLKSFSRGIFGSEMDVDVQFTGTDAALNLLKMSSNSKIQHGPILLLNGFSLGTYAAQSTLVINTADEETNAKIKSIFGDSIGLFHFNVGFTKSYTGDWTLSAIDLKENGAQFKIEKSVISFAGDFKESQSPKMSAEINIGAASFKDATTEIKMEPWVGEMDQVFVDSVPVANLNLVTKKVDIQTAMGFPVTLENLSMEQKQQVVDKKLNTQFVMRLDKFSGPLEVNNTFYQVEFNNLPLEGLKKIYELINSPETQASSEEQMVMLVPALTSILVEGTQFKLNLGSEFMEGKLAGDFNLVYHAPADGRKINEMESPEQMLALFSADLNMTVSESIVNQTPLGAQIQPLVGTYVSVENGVYTLKANLKDTALTIGTQTIPAEQYLPLVMMGAMGFAAGQNPEEPADEATFTEETPPVTDVTE